MKVLLVGANMANMGGNVERSWMNRLSVHRLGRLHARFWNGRTFGENRDLWYGRGVAGQGPALGVAAYRAFPSKEVVRSASCRHKEG